MQNTVEIALRVQRDGHAPSNHGDFVDAVMTRVAELAAEGEYKRAGAEISEALAEEDAASTARKMRLLGKGIDIALLDGDSAAAARMLVERVDLDAGGTASLGDLRSIFVEYYETGRDKGIALDLEVSIDLAEIIKTRAADTDGRGVALNDLATSFCVLRTRESGTARLEQAVAAYEAALQERTQERVPFNWAVTQHCLSAIQLAYFDKEKDAGQLDKAMEHAMAARGVYDRGGATHYVEWIDGYIGEIEARRTTL